MTGSRSHGTPYRAILPSAQPTPSRNSITTVCFVVPGIFSTKLRWSDTDKRSEGTKGLVCWEHMLLLEPLRASNYVLEKFCDALKTLFRRCNMIHVSCCLSSCPLGLQLISYCEHLYGLPAPHSNRRTNKQISLRHLLHQIKVHLPCGGD